MSDNQIAWRITTESMLRQRRWLEAETLTRQVIGMNPRDAQAWVFLAEALEQQGMRGEAWHCYDRGWMLDPQARWAGSAMTRLKDVAGQPTPNWLSRLLFVPATRVVGAILAKNEAEHISQCIQALSPAVDKVYVIDTGSRDDTVSLARTSGAEVIETVWEDDFGRARQAAEPFLGEHGWVLWVDADEFLLNEDVAVPRIIAGLYDDVTPPLLLRIVQMNHLEGRVEPNYDTTRMYPLGKGLTWKGRIHEQVVFRDGPAPMQRGAARIRFDHWGYQRDVMQTKGKYERNINLLRAWTNDEPQNAAAWGFLGRDLYLSGQLEAAIDALYQAEMVGSRDRGYARLPEVRGVLCEALVRLQRLEEARVVADRATLESPEHPLGWYWKGHIALLQAGEKAKIAVESAQRAQELAPQYRGIVSFSPEIPRLLAPLTQADALKMQGRWVDAWNQYNILLNRQSDHVGIQRQIETMKTQAQHIVNAFQPATSQGHDLVTNNVS